MRLSDVVLRRGHLSEDALAEVWSSGIRPSHLDECALCSSRALEVSRWLEDVQALGRADADAEFSDARLVGQKHRILDRLAELDRPSKVISFPAAGPAVRDVAPRPARAGWVALAAAAAGIMIGIVGMELSHELRQPAQPPALAAVAPSQQLTADDLAILEGAFERPRLTALQTLDEMTLRVTDVVLASR